MKLSIVAFALAAQNASAFTSPSIKTSYTQLASTLADDVSSSSKPLNDVKYETTVNVEQKFKVADVDPAVNDPKKRVQT